MKYGMGLIGLFILIIVGCVSTVQREPVVMVENTRDRSFDDGWRFLRGDAPGAEQPAFDDAGMYRTTGASRISRQERMCSSNWMR